ASPPQQGARAHAGWPHGVEGRRSVQSERRGPSAERQHARRRLPLRARVRHRRRGSVAQADDLGSRSQPLLSLSPAAHNFAPFSNTFGAAMALKGMSAISTTPAAPPAAAPAVASVIARHLRGLWRYLRMLGAAPEVADDL